MFDIDNMNKMKIIFESLLVLTVLCIVDASINEPPILERVVKFDYKMELFNEKLAKWEDTIDKKLSDLTDIESLTKSVNDLSGNIQNELNDKTNNLNKRVETLTDKMSMLETDIANKHLAVSETLSTFKDGKATPTVMFNARGVTDKSPTTNQILVYSTIITNVHDNLTGGYNKNTGVFTVPVSGTYLFTMNACTVNTKYIVGYIEAAGTIIATVAQYEDGSSLYTSSSTSGFANLSAGDLVQVKCLIISSGTVLFDDNDQWNSFSGVLIHT